MGIAGRSGVASAGVGGLLAPSIFVIWPRTYLAKGRLVADQRPNLVQTLPVLDLAGFHPCQDDHRHLNLEFLGQRLRWPAARS